MNEENIQKNIKEKVLYAVKVGKVSMRPRLYFFLRLVSVIFLTFVALALSVFVVSFILFSAHEGGEQFLLGFGVRGILTFFLVFPWFTFLLDLFIIFGLIRLLKTFRIGYRHSMIVFISVTILFSVILGFLFKLTPVHRFLLDRADKDDLPFLGHFYDKVHSSHTGQGVLKGTVISFDEYSATIVHDDRDEDADDGAQQVFFPEGHQTIQIGDKVYLFGSFVSGRFQVSDMKVFPSEYER